MSDVTAAAPNMGARDDVYWADFLGIDPKEWAGSGVLFRAHVGLSGFRGLWIFRRGARVVVSAPADWVSRLKELWGGWKPDRLMDPAEVQASLGQDCERCIGPAFQGCLEPGRLRAVERANVRPVVAEDAAAIERFRHACDPDDWSTSSLDRAELLRHIQVEGTQITAMAALRRKADDVGDICALTRPGFRGEGRAAAVVSAVARQALAAGHLVLYQTLESNQPAVKLALSLGFERYANHLAVRLRERDSGAG